MNPSIGVAIRITSKNRVHLASFAGGLVPEKEAEGCFFFLPHDYDYTFEILDEKTFNDTYEFDHTENEKFFVNVYKN